MKLEVGMYVRHKPLLSSKYVKINKIKEIEEKENCLHIWLEDKDLITEKYLIKASYNIIDILEIGDILVDDTNRKLEVLLIDNELMVRNTGLIYDNNYYLPIKSIAIKSVITHEQMEQRVYKVMSE